MSPDRIYHAFVKAFPEFEGKIEKYMAVRNMPNGARLYFYDGRALTVRNDGGGHWTISC